MKNGVARFPVYIIVMPCFYAGMRFSENPRTLYFFRDAFHKSSLDCILNQLSGEVSVALAIFIAISGLREALQFIHADSVLRVTPKRLSASVTVKPNGLITSSLSISPGCVGCL